MPLDEQAAIARVRKLMDAYSRQDFDAAAELADPDIEIMRTGGNPPVKGLDAARSWMAPDAFEFLITEPLEFEVAGDRVLVRQHNRLRGAGSGIEHEFDSWTVWTLAESGLVSRCELFLDHEEAEARRAAGLAEAGGDG